MHDEGVVNGVLLIPDMLSQCLYSHECFSSRVEPPAFLEGRRGQDLDFWGGTVVSCVMTASSSVRLLYNPDFPMAGQARC